MVKYWATYLRQVVIQEHSATHYTVSDDSTGTLELSDEGLAGRVLLIVTEGIQLLVSTFLVAGSILSLICVGKHLPVSHCDLLLVVWLNQKTSIHVIIIPVQ